MLPFFESLRRPLVYQHQLPKRFPPIGPKYFASKASFQRRTCQVNNLQVEVSRSTGTLLGLPTTLTTVKRHVSWFTTFVALNFRLCSLLFGEGSGLSRLLLILILFLFRQRIICLTSKPFLFPRFSPTSVCYILTPNRWSFSGLNMQIGEITKFLNSLWLLFL